MAAATQTRAERIDEYVLRHALSLALVNVDIACGDLIDEQFSVQDIASDLDGPLFGELWPDEDPPEVPESIEHQLTDVRGTALAAAILAQITTTEAQDYFRVEAARLAKLTVDHLREATGAS